MLDKPLDRGSNHGVDGAGLFEEVRRAGNDRQRGLAAELALRMLTEYVTRRWYEEWVMGCSSVRVRYSALG